MWEYSVAGGNLDYESGKLEGAILDHISLGETDSKKTERLNNSIEVFNKVNIKVEIPGGILHWIWIH